MRARGPRHAGTVIFNDNAQRRRHHHLRVRTPTIAWSGGSIDPIPPGAQLVAGFFSRPPSQPTPQAAPGMHALALRCQRANLDFLAAGESITFSYNRSPRPKYAATTPTRHHHDQRQPTMRADGALTAASAYEAGDASAPDLSQAGSQSFTTSTVAQRRRRKSTFSRQRRHRLRAGSIDPSLAAQLVAVSRPNRHHAAARSARP